jgi:hypothetical protein
MRFGRLSRLQRAPKLANVRDRATLEPIELASVAHNQVL